MNFSLRWHRATISLLAAAALAVLAALPAAASEDGHFDRTLTVSGAVSLEVETGSGSITVRTGDSSRVEVHGSIHVSQSFFGDAKSRVAQIEQNPPIQQEGNSIIIGRSDDHELFNNISISYEIVTPKDTKLRATSGSGGVKIDGVAGPVDTTSGSGGLQVSSIGGDVRAHTGSGGIDLENVQGIAHVATGSGSIRAMGIAGAVNASTGSGDVHVQQTAAGDVEVTSGSGSITLENVKGGAHVRSGSGTIHATGEPLGDWSLQTGSGALNVKMPGDAKFNLTAFSGSGSIHTARNIEVSEMNSRHELRGKVNGGGPNVDLRTSSGSIQID